MNLKHCITEIQAAINDVATARDNCVGAVTDELDQHPDYFPGGDAPSTDAEQLLGEFFNLQRAIESLTKVVMAECKLGGRLHDAVLRAWEKAGKSQVKIAGLTVYLDRRIVARATGDEAIAQLKADADTAHLVKEGVNAQSLGAWVREQPKGDDGMPVLPPDLADAVMVAEVFSLRARKA